MDISAKNVMLVLSVIAGVVLVLILVYFVPIIGGTIIGVTVSEVTSATDLSLSSQMVTFINDTETGYITSATSALNKVSIAIAIFAVVIILILFGFTDIFDKLKNWMFGGKSMGGSGPL
jgi:Na+/proline symporter